MEPVAETLPDLEPVAETRPDSEPVAETMPVLEPAAETMLDLEPVVETRPDLEPVAETMLDLEPVVETRPEPAPVAQWLARRTVGRKVWGSNPIRVMWDFSALAGSYPELGVYGPSGKAGTTQPSFIHFTDASLRVLL